MSVFSMTGFGTSAVSVHADGVEHCIRITVRSVNHRHLDVKIRLGRELMSLEPLMASKVREVLQRGHIEVIVETESVDGNRESTLLNRELVRELYLQGISLADELGVDPPLLSEFVRFPGVITTQRLRLPLSDYKVEILQGLDNALASLVSMRAAEGDVLRQDLLVRLERLLTYLAALESALPQLVLEQQERLTERVAALLADSSALDPQRMEFEVALLADKCDVSEEVTRIKGHLMQFRKELMREPSGSGKKLAFVTQELNREFNTIGSKIGNPELISMVIDAKSELEKVREQVANLE